MPFLAPLSDLRRSRKNNVGADAHVEIDQDLSSAANEESNANQSNEPGAVTAPTPSRPSDSAQHCEYTEVSDGSPDAAPPSHPVPAALAPIPVTPSWLLPIAERDLQPSVDKDREAVDRRRSNPIPWDS